MRKIVIDTNVLVSAALRNGYSSKILWEIILDKGIKLCLSKEILSEYKRVSEYKRIRKKYPDFKDKMNDLIEAIEEISTLYSPSRSFAIIKDISDNKFLDLAYESKAHYLITGNRNDFSITQFEQTKILSPKEFCELFEQNAL
jgi:putative PIN family toxin of toxin-antitoxin system